MATDDEVMYIEVPATLKRRIVKLTEGPNAQYSTISEFARAAFREKLEKLGA